MLVTCKNNNGNSKKNWGDPLTYGWDKDNRD